MTTPSELEALVARHQGAVCAIAYAVLHDRALSEEVAQEAFVVDRALATLSATEREAIVLYYRCDQALPQVK